jgi:hypothetical protein
MPKVVIGLFVVTVASAAAFWYINGLKPAVSPVTTATTTVQSSNENSVLDMSTWATFRDTYDGFSVKAPKDRSSVGCGESCDDPTVNPVTFTYTLTDGYYELGPGLTGMKIMIIEKGDDTLDTWINNHILQTSEFNPSPAVISDITEIVLNRKYSALQIDVKSNSSSGAYLSTKGLVPYSNRKSDSIPQLLFDFPALTGRVYVIDLEDRFALVTEALSYNKSDAEQYVKSQGGVLKLLDGTTLEKVYDGILASFADFTPTKR